MGMYLCCKAIRERTDVRVLLTGEISDELFGYKYTDFAPSPEAFQAEPRSGWMSYTCTTCFGRTAASASTPWRPGCPSAILDFVRYVMSVDPGFEDDTYRQGQVPAAPRL